MTIAMRGIGLRRRTVLSVSGVRRLGERDVSGVAKWVLLRPGSWLLGM